MADRRRRGAGPARKRQPTPEQAPPATQAPQATGPRRWPEGSFPVVGVGASAGGYEALSQLLQGLPSDAGAAFVLVQHLDPTRESKLVELLSRSTTVAVLQAQDGTAVEPGHAYVAPPGLAVTIAGSKLKLEPAQADTPRLRMPIDTFFRSLAQDQGARAIGIILSGTGTDGTLGLQEIKELGGLVMVQDPATAKFTGMPQSAIVHSAVDFVLPPAEIALTLVRLVQHPYLASASAADQAETPQLSTSRDGLRKVLDLVQRAHGVDFAAYKENTIIRRAARRVALLNKEDLETYGSYCLTHPEEVASLFHDLLIKVTGFFRDRDCFVALKQTVLPALFQDRPADRPVRIWVPGCATGEEAYSIGIVLFEWMAEQQTTMPKVQIFATDVDELALAKARNGTYVENIALDVSPERLEGFFTRLDHTYRITQRVREVCTFARQDLLPDPPFSNIDLISCRNLLMYLRPAAQQRVFSNFRFALRPTGFLLLGAAETIGAAPNGSFAPVDGKHRIYALQSGGGPAVTIGAAPPGQEGRAPDAANPLSIRWACHPRGPASGKRPRCTGRPTARCSPSMPRLGCWSMSIWTSWSSAETRATTWCRPPGGQASIF